MNRHEQRKVIFKILFQLEQPEISLEDVKFKNDYNSYEYIKSIVDYYLNYKEQIELSIKNHLENFTYDRLPKVDRNLLKLSVTELHVKDVPKKVVINETLILAKLYAEVDSYRYINGVLKNIVSTNNE